VRAPDSPPATEVFRHPVVEKRKLEEAAFHNRLRDPRLRQNLEEYGRLNANKKYYAVTRSSVEFYTNWLTSRCKGKTVLDYGCGDGMYSCLLARHGAKVTGVDISEVSIANCEARARADRVGSSATFRVMDCERLEFADDSFDFVCESGVLHHLDFRCAMAEISRVLKPGGQAICYESLGHNPFIQAYRRLTPHLRTRYETDHIVRLSHLDTAREFFGKVERRFFHLAVLGAVPFRQTRLSGGVLRVLETLDSVLLGLPGLRAQAWIMIFILTNPKKSVSSAR
jgi:SAM-dependent methyltransferase